MLADVHGITCSERNGHIRVSLHIYNDDSDIDALVRSLGSLT
jgi:selenocysteine lyase/cysteine desulfurase